MARAKLQLKPSPLAEKDRPKAAKTAAGAGKGSREGTKLIGGHFSRATWATLRQIGIEQEKTSQALLAEAIEDLIAKYRRR